MTNLNTITLNQLWVIFLGRKYLIILCLLGVVLLGVFSTLNMPKTYTAVASVSFDLNGSNPYASGSSGSNESTFIATSVEILQSKSIAERVYASLSNDDILKVAAAIKGDRTFIDGWIDGLQGDVAPELPLTSESDIRTHYAWLAKTLSSRLKVKPVIGSRVIDLYFVSIDKEVSSLLANQYAQSFIDSNLDTITDPADRTKAWFEERLAMLRANVDKAQQELNAYQRQEGIVSVDERSDMENSKLNALTAELNEAQERHRTLSTQSRQAQRTLTAGGSLETLSEVLDSSTVQNIKGEIRKLESTLAELSNKLGVNHPQYQRVQAEIVENRNKLEEEINIVLIALDNRVIAAKRQVDVIAMELQSQKDKVLGFKSQHGQVDILNQQLERAKALYNSVIEQYNSVNLTSLVSQANISVVDWALTPTIHSGPNMMKNSVLSIVVGLMFGVFMAFSIEMLDRRIRTKDDIVHGLELPVLGVLRSA